MKKSLRLLIIVLIGITFSVKAFSQDANSVFKVKVDFRCMNGKTRLENHFADVKGINYYKVEFDTKTMIFKYDSKIISKDKIIEKIEKVGYYTEFSDRSIVLKPACKRQ